MKKKNELLVTILLLLISSATIYSQLFPPGRLDTISPSNHFYQIFDKQFNIYRYNNSFLFTRKFNKFEIGLTNEYEGFLIRGTEDSKKDAERFNFYFSQNLISYFNFFGELNYNLNSDSRTIGLNEAEKLNGNLGISFNLPSVGKSFITYGIERNKQVSINQQGPRLAMGATIEKINITEVLLNSNFFLERVELKDGRKNSTLLLQTQIDGKFEDQNTLFLALDYQNLRRDYIVFPIYITNFFETRYENKIIPTFGLYYNLFDKTFLSFSGQFYSYRIQRFYNLYDPTNQYTATERTLYEQSLDLNFELTAQTKIFSPKIGVNYFYRNEENVINKKFDIDNITFNQLSSIEFQKNNYQTRLKVFYNFLLMPNNSNTTLISGNASLLRYDTPSEMNDDDRDEFQFISSVSTKQRFSQYYSLTLTFDIQLFHLVFLKSTRSSLNNWNRIIKLSASSDYQTNSFWWKPTFEIFSNYLVYDFESSNIQSFAFRQFVYRDSIEINLSNSLKFFYTIVYKTSERGTLFWKDFSMTKELNIKEIFTKTMLFFLLNNKVQFGFGGRAYNITQKPTSKNRIPDNYSYYSFSPETEIKIFLSKNNVIFLQGWYELKFWNYKIDGKNPNLMLSTRVNL